MPAFEEPVTSKITGNENAIVGESDQGRGVVGKSNAHYGVRGHSRDIAGIKGSSDKSRGVEGVAILGEGVVGSSEQGNGVWGQAVNTGIGVLGTSEKGIGVLGTTTGLGQTAGVWGEHKGAGVGIKAVSKDGIGLEAHSTAFEAVHAENHSPGAAAIAAYNKNPEGTGAAIFAKKEGVKGHAGVFDGNVWVSGELAVGKDIILANADCAEDFDVMDGSSAEPGTVMVLNDESKLRECSRPYDKRVAGVISGAGGYRPGIVLDKQQSQSDRKPIALVGKVFCKVDAQFGQIEVGDLLTTSPTAGHAMRADDPLKAFGAVIGKSLRPLKEGRGLIPILIALQ